MIAINLNKNTNICTPAKVHSLCKKHFLYIKKFKYAIMHALKQIYFF